MEAAGAVSIFKQFEMETQYIGKVVEAKPYGET